MGSHYNNFEGNYCMGKCYRKGYAETVKPDCIRSFVLCSLTVPNEIKKAQMIAALLIDGGSDLQSTVSQAVKREKVDVIEVEYQDYTTSAQQFTALNDILRPFIQSGLRVSRA